MSDARTRAEEVAAVAARLEAEGRLGQTRGYIQHGSVTVYDHVCAVACQSLAMADALARVGLRVDRAALARGALLHDYFLYDWHEKEAWHRFHGFRHPFFALANAERDFPDLSARERNIIERHMFPLVVLPPTCREAWIVCVADKVVATRETLFLRRGDAAARAATVPSAAAPAPASGEVGVPAAAPAPGPGGPAAVPAPVSGASPAPSSAPASSSSFAEPARGASTSLAATAPLAVAPAVPAAARPSEGVYR